MQTLNQAFVGQLVRLIVQQVNPQAVILFGSHARGDARADSDVDLMVIGQEPFSAQRSRRAEYARLSKALREFPSALDILLYSRDEFAYRKDAPNHVVGRAQREGRVIRIRQQAGQCNAGEGKS